MLETSGLVSGTTALVTFFSSMCTEDMARDLGSLFELGALLSCSARASETAVCVWESTGTNFFGPAFNEAMDVLATHK